MIHSELKDATKELLEQCESISPIKGIFVKSATLDTYSYALWQIHGIWSALEGDLNQWFEKNDASGWVRSGAILDDLMFLGFDAKKSNLRAPCLQRPVIRNISDAFGIRYVLEEFSLGGRSIAAQLRQRWSFESGCGASFFDAARVDGFKGWKLFLQEISEAEESKQIDAEMTIQAACQAVRTFVNWYGLNQAPVPVINDIQYRVTVY
jgi:heme oxygenase